MASPKLRFKEFDGDWSLKSINDIASKVGSGSTPRGGAEAYVDEGIIFIRSQNVNDNQLLLNDVVFIPESTHEKMSGSKVLPNDILLNITGASIGRSCVVPESFSDGNVNQHVCIIRTPNDNPIFVQSFLSSENGQNHIQSKQVGGGREGLNFQAIRSFDFEMPSNTEQTKIASFLSSVDEKISQLTQKHELLSQYKQGMMQKLFSQQIRFKADDGSEFGEWEKAKIGTITETIFGYPFDSKEMVEGSSGIPLMRGINIGERHIRHSFELDRFFLKDTSKLEKYFVKVNDIVLSMDGSKVGRNSAFVTEKDAGSLLVQRVCILRKKEKTNIQYVYQWIVSKEFHRYVDQVKTSSGIPHISGKQIQDYEIDCPCLEEQTKIANFLTAIDQKIEVVALQIEQAKQWKKGLLQQMFV
ncbi:MULTISPECIES: restriction endonuclease subunit S [unclassified Acinetobacter]|uniref:restriction endonuclease subunit S n=1 Tax=unclassified Acinetobacter TaxID=196816 RepID=UPI0015D33639|nr:MULTISPECIES: restriction endonuclease subunit S [unclassified Acinetobacter]